MNNLYRVEKIEAYNIAIKALRNHELPDIETGIAFKLREALAAKLDREIQRWVDNHPRL